MRVEIEGDSVSVSWDHIEPDKSFKGYYVILEDVGSEQKENPAYVHVSNTARCAKIIGLRPATLYRLMVRWRQIYIIILQLKALTCFCRYLRILLILTRPVNPSLSIQTN